MEQFTVALSIAKNNEIIVQTMNKQTYLCKNLVIKKKEELHHEKKKLYWQKNI